MLPTWSARVKLDGHISKSVKMQGVLQGGVISLTHFLLYINNITTVLPRHVSNILHADDLAVCSASEYTTSPAYRIQEAVNKVEQWTNDWGLQISEVKTQATVFSLSTSKEKVAIKPGDKTLPQEETPTNRQLSWKRHKKQRMWCLHQAFRQTSILCVSTWCCCLLAA